VNAVKTRRGDDGIYSIVMDSNSAEIDYWRFKNVKVMFQERTVLLRFLKTDGSVVFSYHRPWGCCVQHASQCDWYFNCMEITKSTRMVNQ
jgi:hypothetical protein